MNKHLHIICLNIPYPVDYGGVFDLFYKLPALQKEGVKIHLHCFQYGRKEQPVLNNFCEKVYYYQRHTGFKGFSVKYPYIVKSRDNHSLLDRLAQDSYPIFMEGVHCTFLLNDKRFKGRPCFVRIHNVENIYYNYLSKNTSSFLKKAYFFFESKLLKRYEKSIVDKAVFWSVTENDARIYRKLGCKSIDVLPLFLPEWKVNATGGKGSFCLYHGDLSVAENEKAAKWLIQHVFNDVHIPFVVAGKNPPKWLAGMVESKNTHCLITNPDDNEMQDLIAKAHINIVPSFNATGMKLKLVNALYNGRFCVANEAAVENTGLAEACVVANNEEDFKTQIQSLYNRSFGETEIDIRHRLLDNMFNNQANAQQMVRWIWPEETSR